MSGLAGPGGRAAAWDPVLSALRRHFRLVLMDNRGTGRSDQPDGSFTVADMAGDVVAVLDAAGIGRAHVLGASLGGMVAQELAITWRFSVLCVIAGLLSTAASSRAVGGNVL